MFESRKFLLQLKMISALYRDITLAAIFIVLFTTIPDLIFESIMHLLHTLFEVVEVTLDHLVEALADTGLHNTQVIVFYIIMAFVAYESYKAYRGFPQFIKSFKAHVISSFEHEKHGVLSCWHCMSSFSKVRLILICSTAITAYALLSF